MCVDSIFRLVKIDNKKQRARGTHVAWDDIYRAALERMWTNSLPENLIEFDHYFTRTA